MAEFWKSKTQAIISILFVGTLFGCGGTFGSDEGDAIVKTFTVGGTVSSLKEDNSVVLQNNAKDDLTLTKIGGFTFSTPLSDGEAYEVSVKTNPPDQACLITNGKGTIDGDNVTNVSVVCIGQELGV